MSDNLRKRDYGAAALDGFGMVLDGIGMAIPGVPGVAGLTIQSRRLARPARAAGAKLRKQARDFVSDESGSVKLPGVGGGAKNTGLPNVPGRVQSRVNLITGDESSGWVHVLGRHFNPDKNASQFTVSQSELRMTLQSPKVVSSPVAKTLESDAHGIVYVREVDLGRPIGTDKFNNFQPTSIMTIMTDRHGNLVTATPGVVK